MQRVFISTNSAHEFISFFKRFALQNHFMLFQDDFFLLTLANDNDRYNFNP